MTEKKLLNNHKRQNDGASIKIYQIVRILDLKLP